MKSKSIDNKVSFYIIAHNIMLMTTLWIEMAIDSNMSKQVLMVDHKTILSDNNIIYFMLVTAFILLFINMALNVFFIIGYTVVNFYKKHRTTGTFIYTSYVRYLESYTVVIWLLTIIVWLTINFSYFLSRIF